MSGSAINLGRNPFRAVPPVYSPVRPCAATGAAFTASPNSLDRLRQLLADRYLAEDVVLVDSGTHALQLALGHLVEVCEIDAVALPAFTCYDVATAGAGAASRLEFYDIDPATLEPDIGSFESALATGVAAAVVVHHFGIPVDLEPLAVRAAAHDAVLVEDAAQAHGGSLRGRPLGSLAPYSVLSFGRGKGWTGGGGGALLLRDDPGDVGPVLRDRLTGQAGPGAASAALNLTAQWMLARPLLYGLPSKLAVLGLGDTVYEPPTPPGPMSASGARIIVATTGAADTEARARRSAAKELTKAAAPMDVTGSRPKRSETGYLRMPLRVRGRAADDVVDRTARSLGLIPSYPQALPALPEIRALRGGTRDWSGAEALARELFTAPTHSRVGAADRRRLAGWLRTLSVDPARGFD